MARRKSVRKVIAHNATYLEPLNCDSTVSYKIIESGKRVWGSIQLADCQRKIEWYFSDTESLDKVDSALKILTEFRTILADARIARAKRLRAKRKVAVKVVK